MTTVALSEKGMQAPRLSWPKSFSSRLHDINVPTVGKMVWYRHMRDSVWPDGTNLLKRLWRLCSGVLTGFYLGWILGVGREDTVMRVVRLTFLLWLIIAILSIALSLYFENLYLLLITGFSLLHLAAFFLAHNLRWGHHLYWLQANWFLAHPEEVRTPGLMGPGWNSVPAHLKKRIGKVEEAGHQWFIAWTMNDPLVFAYPTGQIWRCACIGGWDANTIINNT